MNKFLDELYENFPELEKSKEGVDKAVYYLKDNKPVFSTSNEFKNNLKSRINGLVGLKSKKKSNFLIFAIPLSSFVFIIAGFLYYFKDVKFFIGPNNARNFEISSLKIDDDLNNNNQQLEEKLGYDINEKNEPETIENTSNEKISNENISSKNIDKVNNNTQEISTLGVEKNTKEMSTFSIVENNKSDEIIPLENDEIGTVLEAVGETYDFKMSDNADSQYFGDSSIDSLGDSINSMSDMTVSRSFKIQENYETFIDFCNGTGGIIYEAGNDQICSVDKKECLSSNYINGTCEFNEIK